MCCYFFIVFIKPFSVLELQTDTGGSTQLSVQWVTRVLSPGVKGPKRKVTL